MDTMENNYAIANTMINYNNLLENYHRNDILRQMVTELHIGTCQLNGAVENLANVVGNSIDKQTEALRKRKYVLVDKFYNVYDEIVKMKYDEEKKCFMMFGKNHSWKIFITSDMDEYNFERLNTKLSYSELYDTVITLDYLVNAFGVEYSLDLFNSRINKEETDKLNELLKKSKDIELEKSSKINSHKEETNILISRKKIDIESLKSKIKDIKKNSYSCVTVESVCIISIFFITCIIMIVLGACLGINEIWIIGLFIGGVVAGPFFGVCLWNFYHYKKQGYNPSTIIKQLSEKENELKKELEVFNSNVAQEILNIENEYNTKLKDANNKIEEFVKSLCK